MIEIPFGQFMDGNYEEGGRGYELYIVKHSMDILYVGRSRQNIWDRWFGDFGRMRQYADGSWYFRDSISREIIDNMPKSLCWMIELWTREDCAKFFADKIKTLDFFADSCDITDYEPWMIQELHPKFNCTYNT